MTESWCATYITRLQLILANPGGEVIKKMNKAKLIDVVGEEWVYLTVGEAVGACNFMLR